MKGILLFLAVFFTVVSLDLLDQNRVTGALFFAVASAVITVLIFSNQKTK